MYFTCIAFGVFFILAGIAIALGLVHTHLKGWKETPEEEKANIRIGALCRNVGFMIALAGIVIFVAGVNQFFRENLFVWLMIAWIILCIIDIWLMGRKGGSRYLIHKDLEG